MPLPDCCIAVLTQKQPYRFAILRSASFPPRPLLHPQSQITPTHTHAHPTKRPDQPQRTRRWDLNYDSKSGNSTGTPLIYFIRRKEGKKKKVWVSLGVVVLSFFSFRSGQTNPHAPLISPSRPPEVWVRLPDLLTAYEMRFDLALHGTRPTLVHSPRILCTLALWDLTTYVWSRRPRWG